MRDGRPHFRQRVRHTLMRFAAVACLVCAACSPDYEPPLRIGVALWPGHEPMFLARSLGYYDDQPIHIVELPSTVEAIRAYRNGAIDVVGVTADEALTVAASEPAEHRIFLVADVSHGADTIIATPQVRTLADLEGKRIGYEANALGATMLARALDLAGLTSADVTRVPLSMVEQQSAYEQGRVDALVTFEPYASRLLALGAHRIFDSSQIPGEIVDVFITRRMTLETRTAALREFVEGWLEGLQHFQRNPGDAAHRVAARHDMTGEELLATLRQMHLPDGPANRRLLGGERPELLEPLRRLSLLMASHKLIGAPVDPAPLLDGRLLPSS